MEAKLLTADRFVDTSTGCSYRYVHSSTEYFRPHFHDYYEIFVVIDGSAIHKVNGTSIDLSRGDAVFIRPDDTHDYVCKKGSEYYMLNITFTAQTLEEMCRFLGDGFNITSLLSAKLPPSVKLNESEMSALSAQMSAITAIRQDDSDKRKSSLRIFIFDMFTKCFSSFREKKENGTPRWLSSLRAEMRKMHNFTRGTDAVCELCDKSREHISRSMKRYYGVTVSEFINDLRLNYVANMLVHSNSAVIDIVFESGFNNVSWASKCFKKKYGVSMQEYRKINSYKE